MFCKNEALSEDFNCYCINDECETTKAVCELVIVVHHIRPSDIPKRRILCEVLQSGKTLMNDMAA